MNEIAYREHDQSVLGCEMETVKGKQAFIFLTNIKITKKNAKKIVNAGRSRWKIENEGFQQTKKLTLPHTTRRQRELQRHENHYLLTQITDIIMVLHEHGSKPLKRIKKTVKEISSQLLKAFRGRTLTDEDIANLGKPIQIRFI